MAVHVKEIPALVRLIYVLCVIGEILTSTFVTSDGHLGQYVDNLMTDLYSQDDSTTQLLTYCNHHDTVSGQEGQYYVGYSLAHVHMVIAPGETNTLDSKGQGHTPYLACSLQSDTFSTDKISSFQETVNVYRMVQTERHGFKEFHPNFNSQCSENHLTESGFKQVVATGEHLYKSYFNKSSYSRILPKSSHVHVESIPEQHVYQSALGLLHGMLPEKEFVNVRIHKSPDNFCDTTESDLSSCGCDFLNELKPFISQSLTEGKYTFKNSIPDIDKLRKLFGAYSDNGLSAVKLLKLFRLARCNGLSSVCDTYGQCYNVTNKNEETLLDLTSKFLHQLFTNPTIRQFSEVATYPFLQRLVDHMDTDSNKLRIYMGTEQFLDLLKTSLNIFRDTPLPVASRFVFEVYQKSENQLDAGQHYIRVLLNGEDLTQQVEGCHGNLENGLCSADIFKNLVSASQQQYSQKCKVQKNSGR